MRGFFTVVAVLAVVVLAAMSVFTVDRSEFVYATVFGRHTATYDGATQAEIDPEGPGGAYMLGLRQLGVVAHGRFTRRGFARAIEVAARGVQEDVIGRTRAALEAAGALRSHSGGSDESGSSEQTATLSSR